MAFAALGAAVFLTFTACSDDDAARPTPVAETPALPPTATASPSQLAEPTAATGPKMRAVNIEDGRDLSLPVLGASSAWSPDSKRLAVANREEGLVLVDVSAATRTVVRAGPCRWVEWSSAGELAAECGDRIYILDPTGRVVSDYGGKADYHAWAKAGGRLAFASWMGPIFLYDGSSWVGFDCACLWIGWLNQGGIAMVSQPDPKSEALVRVLDTAPGYPILTELKTRVGANSVSVSPDGTRVSYAIVDLPPQPRGTFAATVYLVNLLTGAESSFRANPQMYPNAPLEFSPDSTAVLVQTGVCEPGKWKMALARSDGVLETLAGGTFGVVKFSPDGKRIGFTRGTELWVLEFATGAQPKRLAEGIHGPAGFVWSPDSKWMAAPSFFGGFGACE